MNAFWIKYNNQIKTVDTVHIQDVLTNPEWFDITSEYIKQCYDTHNEPLGHEGKARSEIMRALINKGFVRVRYSPKIDLYTFEVNKLNDNTKEQIFSFFTDPTISKRKHSNVIINELHLNKDVSNKTNVADILSYKGLFESKTVFKQILEKVLEEV